MATKISKVHVEDVYSFRLDVFCDNSTRSAGKLRKLEGILEVVEYEGWLMVQPDLRYNRKELIQDIVNLLSKE